MNAVHSFSPTPSLPLPWSGTISTDFNVDLRTCDCFSPSAVKPGKELRIFYGARSNAELFLHQGFVYPPNTGDTLRIKLGGHSHVCVCVGGWVGGCVGLCVGVGVGVGVGGGGVLRVALPVFLNMYMYHSILRIVCYKCSRLYMYMYMALAIRECLFCMQVLAVVKMLQLRP